MTVNGVPETYRFGHKVVRCGRGLVGMICLLFAGILQAQQNCHRNLVSSAIEPATPTYRLPDDGNVNGQLDGDRGTVGSTRASRIQIPPVSPQGRSEEHTSELQSR